MTGERDGSVRAIFLAAIMVLSVLVMGVAFSGGVAAASSTVTVGNDGEYSTIQEAVGEEGSDTVIEVIDGTYDETVTFDSGVSNVTIKASDVSNLPEITGGIEIKASVSDLTVKNVKLSGEAGASRTFQVASGSLSDVTLDGVTFEGDDTQAVAVYGNAFSGNVTLKDITVANYTNANWGIVYVATNSGLEDVELSGSNVQASGGMVEFHGNEPTSGENITAVTIQDNTFKNIAEDSDQSASAALSVQDAENASISGNSFTNNFNHIHFSDVTGETTQSVVSGNDIDRAAYTDTLVTSSIQNAVDDAESGDTVTVIPGTYTESVSISTANVKLEATGDVEETVIDAPDGSTNVLQVMPSANGVTVDGFTITDGERRGIFVGTFPNAAEGVTIANNRIVDNGGDGATEQTHGILVDGGNDTVIRGNLIANLSTDGSVYRAAGISIVQQDSSRPSANVSVVGNTIRNVSAPDAQTGKVNAIELSQYLEDTNVSGNTIEELTANKATGVRLLEDDGSNGPTNFTIVGNDIGAITGDTDENAIAVGGYTGLGADHWVGYNDFNDGMVAYYLGSGDTLNATSNWWGATDGPNGPDGSEYVGHGASVSANVNADDWITVASGEVNVDHDFVGIVSDDEVATISGDDIELEEGLGPAFGKLVYEVGDQTFTATMTDGEIDDDQTFDPTTISKDVSTGTDSVDVVSGQGENGYASVGGTDDVTLVHEALAFQEGWNLESIPQPAAIYGQNISDVTTWVTGEGYASLSGGGQGEPIESARDLHSGFYVKGDSDEARIGYDFVTDSRVSGSAFVMNEGWHLASSNFDISSGDGERTLKEDLANVQIDSNPGVTVWDAGLGSQIAGGTTISAYDTYWVYVDGQETRSVVGPNYDPATRSLGDI